MHKNIEGLIVRYLTGNTSPIENEQLFSWLKVSAENQLEFDRIKKIWDASYALKINDNIDVEAAWEEFKILAQKPLKQKNTSFGVYLKVAASLLLLASLAVVFTLMYSEPQNESTTIAELPNISVEESDPSENIDNSIFYDDTTELNKLEKPDEVNAPDKHKWKKTKSHLAMITLTTSDSAKVFLLPDNSIVFLNDHSTLTYPENFRKNNRKILLNGEAYFEVARDTMQFVVACHNTISRSTEASFNIKGYKEANEVEIILASGSVEFSGIGKKTYKKLTLSEGERATYSKDNQISKAKNHRKDYKWWQKKNLRAKIKKLIEKIKNNFR